MADHKNNDLDEIFKKEMCNEFHSEFYRPNGSTLLPTLYKKLENDIENFDVRQDDIWVTSFPKSGTTWVQEMVWLIANNLDYQKAKTHIRERFPFLEFNGVIDFDVMDKLLDGTRRPECIITTSKYLTNLQEKRFIKSHLPWQMLPQQIRNNTKQPKIIHVIRNPKDVCVSFLHHHRQNNGYDGDAHTFVKLFLADKVLYCPYWYTTLSYWSRRHQPNLLVLKYEDMKKNLPSIIRQAAKFLEKDLTENQMRELAHHLSFDQMKKNNAVNYSDVKDKSEHPRTGPDFEFMRKGTVGSYKDLFNEEIDKAFDDWIKINSAGTDLTFEYFI